MNRILTALILMTLTVLAGCVAPTTVQTEKPVNEDRAAVLPAEVAAPVPSVLAEIYVDIDGTVVAFTEAIELLESGSVETGEAMLGDAILGLDDLVSRCRAITGCTSSRTTTAWSL